MIRMDLDQLKPGMKLARDIVLPDGRLLLLAGFAIKPLYIRKLDAFKIKEVFIEEGSYTPIEELAEEKVYRHAADVMKNIFTLVGNDESVDTKIIKDTVDEILHSVIENETVMLQLAGIRDIDNYTYLHSIDVCIYSTIIGKKLGYDRDLLMTLGMGALLHDIGKCKVSNDILLKPCTLTDSEFSQMKLHTVYGCEIIKSSYRLSTNISNIAYLHHEKWNGTGYPLGLAGHAIDPLSRIVALADVYDALTSDRIYKSRELPHNAADYICRNAGILFDPYLVDLFTKSIAVYAEGTLVLLNTGELGSVISSDNIGCSRQTIFVFSRKSGPPVLQPYTIDLNEHPDIDIVDVYI